MDADVERAKMLLSGNGFYAVSDAGGSAEHWWVVGLKTAEYYMEGGQAYDGELVHGPFFDHADALGFLKKRYGYVYAKDSFRSGRG